MQHLKAAQLWESRPQVAGEYTRVALWCMRVLFVMACFLISFATATDGSVDEHNILAHSPRSIAVTSGNSSLLNPARAGGASPLPGTSAASGYAYRAEDVSFHTPIAFPPHEKSVEIEVDLGLGE